MAILKEVPNPNQEDDDGEFEPVFAVLPRRMPMSHFTVCDSIWTIRGLCEDWYLISFVL